VQSPFTRPLPSKVAERKGFEPLVEETPTTVFETVAFNRSAISPRGGVAIVDFERLSRKPPSVSDSTQRAKLQANTQRNLPVLP
jgi:hypothetical protein